MLVWLDLETTGLDPREQIILEVAAIVTDDQLNEVARYQRLVHYDQAAHFAALTGDETDEQLKELSDNHDIHPNVLRMHAKNGLWRDVAATDEDKDSRANVEIDFVKFLETQAVEQRAENGIVTEIKPQLAGSTISFDRNFLMYEMPDALEKLHYRNIDVSTLNELGRRFWPTAYASRPTNETKAHRGMADIEESIRLCKHYLGLLKPAV